MKVLYVHSGVGITEGERMTLQTKIDENIRIVTTSMEFIDEFLKDQLEADIKADLLIFDRSVSEKQISEVLHKWGTRPIYKLWITGVSQKSSVVDDTSTTLEKWKIEPFLSWLSRKVA